jgi:hypothetical protein
MNETLVLIGAAAASLGAFLGFCLAGYGSLHSQSC